MKVHYNTLFQDPRVIVTNVTPTLHIRVSTILALAVKVNGQIPGTGDIQWHDSVTKFYENWSSGSNFERTHTLQQQGADISCSVT
jgi:hypothetical protein